MHQASQVPLVSVAASRRHLTRGQHHQMPVLGRDQDAAVTETVQDEPFQGADRHVSIRQPAGRGSQGHPVRPAQVQAEGLSPLDQAGQVGIATQQVVDQLAAQRLLPADPLPASGLVAPDECSHRAVDDAHHRLSGGAHLLAVPGAHRERKPPPQPPRRRQVQVDSPRRGHTLLSGPAPQDGHGRQLPLTGLTPRYRRISQQRQVVAQQLDRSPRTARGGHRHRSQPVIVARPGRGCPPLPPRGRPPVGIPCPARATEPVHRTCRRQATGSSHHPGIGGCCVVLAGARSPRHHSQPQPSSTPGRFAPLPDYPRAHGSPPRWLGATDAARWGRWVTSAARRPPAVTRRPPRT